MNTSYYTQNIELHLKYGYLLKTQTKDSNTILIGYYELLLFSWMIIDQFMKKLW